jgi:hypothetical protein
MLAAAAAGGFALEVGVGDLGPARLAAPVGALAQTLQRAVHRVEHGGGAGQFELPALLHEGQGSARMGSNGPIGLKSPV